MTNVVKLPTARFHELVGEVERVEFHTVVRLLTFALDNNLSTRPIVQLLAQRPIDRAHFAVNLRPFLQWCEAADFKVISETIDRPPSSGDKPPYTPAQKAMLKILAEVTDAAGARRQRVDEHVRNHKYGFFRPGWEMDSALWSQIFGDDDPAAVIGFYSSSFLKREHKPSERRVIALTSDDLAILEWLLEEAASSFCREKGRGSAQLLSVVRGALATACGLEPVLDFSIHWTSPQFLAAIVEGPESLANYLLQYWAERIDIGLELSDDLRKQAINQARFMAACLLKYLAPDADLDKLKMDASDLLHSLSFIGLDTNVDDLDLDFSALVPSLSFIGDRTLIRILEQIYSIEVEGHAEAELYPIRELLAVAIYNARDTVFGGMFPFTLREAGHIIGPAHEEKGFWLAQLAFCADYDFEGGADIFGLYDDEHGQDADGTLIDSERPALSDGTIRTNRRARRRYEAYRAALDAMEQDGLQELAGAWWAFFIASQVIAFPGFGLPSRELQTMTKRTKSLMSNGMVAKAVEFSMLQERDRTTNVASRVSLALLRELAAGAERSTPRQVIDLGDSDASVEAFLQRRLGKQVWAALGEQSRRDLIEAERLWSRAAQDFAAGRSDWGSLVALYSRPIEAEVRIHLAPLLQQLQEAGLCNVGELTLGGCVNAIRDANRAFRTGEPSGFPERHRSRVSALHAFFGQQAKFIAFFRNRASHGNREEPITTAEFSKWRTAIFEDGLFSVLLDIAY